MSEKPLILILCTGNSCRSQLAEGWLRQFAGDFLEVASASSKPAGHVHPFAIQVMREVGVDISSHTSKHVNEFLSRKVETVITVCGNADQACPMFPGQVNRHHWPFDDPAHATGTEAEKIVVFRHVRDQIAATFRSYVNGRSDPCPILPDLIPQPYFELLKAATTEAERRAIFHRIRAEVGSVLQAYKDGRRDAPRG